MVSASEAIEALKKGELVSVPYHVESYGPGRTYHSWGDPVVGEASGPEGYLRLGLSDEGIIIDEWEDWCPSGMQGMRVDGSGRYIHREAKDTTTDEQMDVPSRATE